jgi:glucosyl-3-phosphoglycerate synthase
VTELTARPLLAAFYPDLAPIRQPLAGEFAARRELLEHMAFCTGYGVEIGLLLDVCSEAGIEAIAQVDLGVRQNRHQPLEDLAPMAAAVLGAVTRRLRREGRLTGEGGRDACERDRELPERPALASLRALEDAA